MKRALLISSNNCFHLIHELPYLLKKGGFHVTALSSPHYSLTHSSYVDELLQAPSEAPAVIEQAIALLAKSPPFDLIILGSDQLVWALADRPFALSVKSLLYPIKNPNYLDALNGKIGAASLYKKLDILAPPSQTACCLEEALTAAEHLGFPVMLKVSRSGAGNGVYRCGSPEEIIKSTIPLDKPFLVEKHLEGDLISVEPLFFHGRLAAYSYSVLTYCPTPLQPSLERIFMPCPEIEPILQKLGRELQMNGFANLSFIRDRSNKHYLFELDFRPNRWIRYGELAGVNWAKALKEPSQEEIQSPQCIKQLNHFPADLWHAIKTRNKSRFLSWLFNRNNRWQSIPLYDKKLLFREGFYFLKKITKLYT